MRLHSLAFIIFVLAGSFANGALSVFPAQPITHQLTVNPIVVSDGFGGPAANFFGTPAQQAQIEGYVDTIMAQAGIDVEWLAAKSFDSPDFNAQLAYDQANTMGTYASVTPDTIESTVPTVVNMWFVAKVAQNLAPPSHGLNGRAFLDGEGVAIAIGSDLLTPPFHPVGLEAIGAVVAHELSHNLGLEHVVTAENLMLASLSGDPIPAQLSAGQIATIFTDDAGFDGFDLLVPVPEPGSAIGLFAALGLLGWRRRRS